MCVGGNPSLLNVSSTPLIPNCIIVAIPSTLPTLLPRPIHSSFPLAPLSCLSSPKSPLDRGREEAFTAREVGLPKELIHHQPASVHSLCQSSLISSHRRPLPHARRRAPLLPHQRRGTLKGVNLSSLSVGMLGLMIIFMVDGQSCCSVDFVCRAGDGHVRRVKSMRLVHVIC